MKTHSNSDSVTEARFPGKIQNRYLDRSILLRETGTDASVKKVVFFSGAILIFFLVWANFLHINETASTTGELLHQGEAVKVQHLFGGRVKEVMVKDGSFVQEGEVLLRLDPAISILELEAIRGKARLLAATKIRLEALLSGIAPDFTSIKDPGLAQAERNLYEHTVKTDALEEEMILNQVEQIAIQIQLQKNTQEKLRKTTALIKEELDIRMKLESKGLNSRVTLLQLEKEYNEALFSLKQSPETLKNYQEKQKELKNTLANKRVRSQQEYAEKLIEASTELMTLEKNMRMFDSAIDALEIKAPVSGYVHDLKIHSIGEVAKSGDILLTLIPTDKPLIAQIKISSKDIGHVKVGQQALIRLTTYDSRRYGVLKGKVTSISPSAFIPEDRTAPYYEGIIHLEENVDVEKRPQMTLFSGMTLTADVKTGSKTLVEYLLKPIYIATQTSFHER